MSESNNIKFVEVDGKWIWKRYDEQGSVIFTSPEFASEALARENYNSTVGGSGQESAPAENTAGTADAETAPAGDSSAGTAGSAQA